MTISTCLVSESCRIRPCRAQSPVTAPFIIVTLLVIIVCTSRHPPCVWPGSGARPDRNLPVKSIEYNIYQYQYYLLSNKVLQVVGGCFSFMLTQISQNLISINYISTYLHEIRAICASIIQCADVFCYNHQQHEDDDQSTSCDPKFSTKSCLCLICSPIHHQL